MAWALASSSAALPPEFEMQRVSQSQKHSWVAWVLQEATRPKQENQRRPEKAQIPPDSRRVFAYPCSPAASWRSLAALSHEPLGGDVNALQRLAVGDRNRCHGRERYAHGVQRR